MSDLPLVTVVIPTHQRPELVRRAIQSVVDQTYAGPIEIVVVHDKEDPDPTLESDDPLRTVRAYRNDHTENLPGARNAGLDRTHGAVYASLDDDDHWVATKLEKQLAHLDAHPEHLVVASGMYLHTAGGKVTTRPLPPPEVTHADLLRSHLAELHSSNLVMRIEAFDRIGRYAEEIVGAEDYDWCLRATEVAPIGLVPEHLVHVFRDTPLWRPPRWQRIARGREQLLARHPDLATGGRGEALFFGKIAFAYAAGEDRRNAFRWARRSFRAHVADPWAVIAVLVAAFHLPTRWVQRGANLVGRSI